jgi:hypothetical protein
MIHRRDTKGGAQSCSIQYKDVDCRGSTSPARHHPLASHHRQESSQPVHNVHYARIVQVYCIVRVCRDDQLAHGKSHALRVIVVASEDIAKVARRNHELDLGVFGMRDLLADLEVGENAGPVDRVDCTEMVFLVEGPVREQRLTMS